MGSTGRDDPSFTPTTGSAGTTANDEPLGGGLGRVQASRILDDRSGCSAATHAIIIKGPSWGITADLVNY